MKKYLIAVLSALMAVVVAGCSTTNASALSPTKSYESDFSYTDDTGKTVYGGHGSIRWNTGSKSLEFVDGDTTEYLSLLDMDSFMEEEVPVAILAVNSDDNAMEGYFMLFDMLPVLCAYSSVLQNGAIQTIKIYNSDYKEDMDTYAITAENNKVVKMQYQNSYGKGVYTYQYNNDGTLAGVTDSSKTNKEYYFTYKNGNLTSFTRVWHLENSGLDIEEPERTVFKVSTANGKVTAVDDRKVSYSNTKVIYSNNGKTDHSIEVKEDRVIFWAGVIDTKFSNTTTIYYK